MPNYANVIALASNEEGRTVVLSGSTTVLFLSALGESVEKIWTWIGSGDFGGLTEAEKDSVDAMIATAERELMTGITGVFFTEIVDRQGSLLCDGTEYLREDYPALYEHWAGTSLIVDADTFHVPDFRRKFVMGADSEYEALDTGGEETVTLTINEIPSHSHSEISAVPALINGGLEAPASAATPSVDSTGLTGNSQAHNNMPPFVALRWYVWT